MRFKTAVDEFTERLHAIIESDAMERARAAVLSAFGAAPPKRRGRPPKLLVQRPAPAGKARRKKMPPQLCPVPGCKNKAAPIFGMVCAKHKDVPKALIKKYREARRAKKEGVKIVARKAPTKSARKARKPPARKTTTKVAKKSVKPAPMVAKKTTKRRAAPATKKPIAKETPTASAAPAAA